MVVQLEWYVSATDTSYVRTIEDVIDIEVQLTGPDCSVEIETKTKESTIIMDLGDDCDVTVFTDNGVQIEQTTKEEE